MSILISIVFICRNGIIRRALSRRNSEEIDLVALVQPLVGLDNVPDTMWAALEKGIILVWEDAYGFVHPFGDRRGSGFESVWTFDLDKDVLILTTREEMYYSAPLEVARQRVLTPEDMTPFEPPPQFTALDQQSFPPPHWQPDLQIAVRIKPFLGRIVQDFGRAWCHVLRRRMRHKTFLRLAYAVVWISAMDFSLHERTGFEHVSEGGVYVFVLDLPDWEVPQDTVVWAGSSWFVLTQDVEEGLDMIRRHYSVTLKTSDSGEAHIYVVLTLRHVMVCKADHDGLVCTRLEPLFGNEPASEAAIDMLLWGAHRLRKEPASTQMNNLPVDVQSTIMNFATISLVASARLGCELGLGLPFAWMDEGLPIKLKRRRRHRGESSPVETQIMFDGVRSGISYRREYVSRFVFKEEIPPFFGNIKGPEGPFD